MSSDRPSIRPLPGLLIDQIAAGEVIERPASVVKELVENALDAGARQIRVELAGGGIGLVRVRDDGHGIPREELPLALGRHCTSKLRALADLDGIATLGFRGEALPSIASVSRLRLVSCVDAAVGAFEVTQEGSSTLPAEARPAAHPPGTTVEVRDLFHNVPARRRFLKAERTEFDHVEQFLRRLALSRPGVAFRLEHPGRRGFSVPPAPDPGAQAGRLATLMGRAFAETMQPVEARVAELALGGWIAPPDTFAPAHSGLGLWTVNGRVVRDPVLARTVRMACADLLPPGRHPAFCLHLELDPLALDVNVHPMKLEVRYRDARRVQDFVLSALRAALAAAGARRRPAVSFAAFAGDVQGSHGPTPADAGPLPGSSYVHRHAVAEPRVPSPDAWRMPPRHAPEPRGTPWPADPSGPFPVPASVRPAAPPAALHTGAGDLADVGSGRPVRLADARAWVVPAAGGLHVLDVARWLADRAWQALGSSQGPPRRLLLAPQAHIEARHRQALGAAMVLLEAHGLLFASRAADDDANAVVHLLALPECLAPLAPEALLGALVQAVADPGPVTPRDWRGFLSARFLALAFRVADEELPPGPAPGDAAACLPASPFRPFWHWVPLSAGPGDGS